MLPLLARNWFLLVLVGLIAAGLAGAPWLGWLQKMAWLRLGIMAVVMFLMAFPIPAEEIGRTIARPWASILATVINYGVLPLVAWALSLLMLLFANQTLMLREGILIAAATPCTLASAAVWTRKAGGNDAAALLVTMITNALCFVITPYWLYFTTGTQADFGPDKVNEMVFQLGVLVLLPMVVAQLVRLWPPIGEWSSGHKDLWAALAMSGVLCIVFFGAIQSGLELRKTFAASAEGHPWLETILQIVAAGVIVVVVHISMVFFGWWSASITGLERDDRVAVAISGSQKTLMVGLYLAASFGGLAMLPMVIYHCGQLIFDSIIAEYWAESAADANALPIESTS